jgi:DNA-binding NtrC family response regulator
VDDNVSFLSGLAELLKSYDIDVTARSSFAEAREFLLHHAPDLIATDVRLREYNGLHLVLLARAQRPDVIAFVYSAHSDAALLAEVEACGAVFVDRQAASGALVAALGASAHPSQNLTH